MIRCAFIVAVLILKQYCLAEECVTSDPCTGPTFFGHCTTDAAKCRCVAGLSASSTATKCELKQPTITGVTDNQVLVKHQSYSLVCKPILAADGYSFKWFKDSGTAPISTSDTYSITSAMEADVGTYKCSATLTALGNDPPVDSTEIHLKVSEECVTSSDCRVSPFNGQCTDDTTKCKCLKGLSANPTEQTCELKSPTITGVTDKQELVRQQSYSLVCNPIEPAPGYLFKWFKDSAILPIATSNKYSIASAKETDGGTYKCSVALGTIPAVESNLIHLTVSGDAVTAISSAILTIGAAVLTRILNAC